MQDKNKWQTDSSGFLEAVRENEYAEFLLSTGDILVTDWESPIYILIENDYPDEQSAEDELTEAIYEEFEIVVECFEMDTFSEDLVYPIWYPSTF